MPIAFVLIKTETGSENEVLQSLKKIDHVVEAYAVYSGAYEIVAKITAETMDKLKEVVRSHVRRIDKVQSTMTMIVSEETPANHVSADSVGNMGSVKDLEVVKKPMKDETGIGRFHFSDRYSVFDWGEMPDLIEEKGAALCIISAYFFERLEEKGIKTHYRGLVENGRLVTTDRLKRPCNVMEIDFVNVFHPTPYREAGKLKYDYSVFTPNLNNFLIPLEFMYRNSLPEGSSVFKRLKQGLKPEDLGLDYYPKPGEKLKKPILDVSTKLEERDRYITWSEAQKIAGLTDEETVEIKAILLEVNDLITETASRANLTNEDGKVELAFDPQRKLIVVDAIGTLDECRFTYKGFHVSKEIARQYYRKTKWYRDVEKANREADSKGIKDWKSLCKSQPPPLDPALGKIICDTYKAAANELTGLGLFDVSSLADVIEDYQTYLGEQK